MRSMEVRRLLAFLAGHNPWLPASLKTADAARVIVIPS